MRILVYGAGAVGGFLGGLLAAHDDDVTLIVRPETGEIIERTGLTIVRPGSHEIRIHSEVVTSVRLAFVEGLRYDLVLLTMKSYDVAAALNPFAAFCPEPYPPILALQNGIGVEKVVADLVGQERVIAGSLTTPLSRETPGRVVEEHSGRGLGLAPVKPGQNVDQWVTLFNEAGVATERFDDYQAMKWSKALLNMVGNATSAIINRHPRVVYNYEPTFQLEMEMLQEALAVMSGLKLKVVDLPGAPAGRLAFAVRRLPDFLAKPILTRAVGDGRGNKLPSFHMDLTAGKKQNEVRFHNGAVVVAGRELGIPTPVNAALTDILLKMARQEIDWQLYDGNPRKLVETVARYKARVR